MKNLGFFSALIFGGLLSLSYLGINLKYEHNETLDQQPVFQDLKAWATSVGEETTAPEVIATGLEAQGAFEEVFPGNAGEIPNPGVVTVEADEEEKPDPKEMGIQTRPGLDIINLSMVNDKAELITLEVFDQSGKKILSRSATTAIGTNSWFFNLEYVSTGIYLVTASTADWTNTKKVYKHDLI